MNAFIDKFYFAIIIVLSTLLLSFLVTIYILNNSNENLTNQLNDRNNLLALAESNNINLKSSINEQNQAIEKNKTDYEAKLKEFEEWKNKPVEVKYQYITKEVKSNECKDIKDSINRVRGINF